LKCRFSFDFSGFSCGSMTPGDPSRRREIP